MVESERDDLVECRSPSKPYCKRLDCSFTRVAPAPVLLRQTPADLDARGEHRLEAGDVETDEPDERGPRERRVGDDLDRPEAPAPPVEALDDPVDERVALARVSAVSGSSASLPGRRSGPRTARGPSVRHGRSTSRSVVKVTGAGIVRSVRRRWPRFSIDQRWCTGHEYVVRPPTVRRCSGAPSVGHTRCRDRAACRRCGCRRAGRARAACCGSRGAAACVRRDRCRPAGAAGSMPGAPQRFVDEQIAEPGDARLVHEHRLDRRACAASSAWSSCASGERERVGTETRLVGIELDRAEPARVAQHERAAVGEVHAEAMPRRRPAGCSRRRAGHRPRRRRRAPGRSSRGAARATGAASAVSRNIDLPRPPCRGEPVARPARARTAAGVVPRLRNHVSGACTDAISRSSARAVEHRPRRLDLQNLRHESEVGDRARFGALRELARTWRGSRSCSAAREASSSPCAAASSAVVDESSIVCASASMTMRSPSATNAIGPPSTASGATWPTQNPCVPPENRPSVMSAASAPRPGALHRAGDREHLAHAGATLRTFVADHDDVAGFDLAREDLLHRRVLAVEDTRGAVEARARRCRRPSRPHPSARASRAGSRCRPARGSADRAGARPRRRARAGRAPRGSRPIVWPVTVRQSPCSSPASSSIFITTGTPPTASRSTMWNLPCGFMSAMCANARADAVEVVELELDPRLVARSRAGAAPRWSSRRAPSRPRSRSRTLPSS